MFIFIMDPATTTLSTLPYTTLFRSERIEDLPQAAARPNLKAFPVEVSRETGQVAPSVLERKFLLRGREIGPILRCRVLLDDGGFGHQAARRRRMARGRDRPRPPRRRRHDRPSASHLGLGGGGLQDPGGQESPPVEPPAIRHGPPTRPRMLRRNPGASPRPGTGPGAAAPRPRGARAGRPPGTPRGSSSCRRTTRG